MTTLSPFQLAGVILGKASLIDSRVSKPDEHVLTAWAEILAAAPPITLEQAGAIVTAHYSQQGAGRIMPGDVLAAARTVPRPRPRLQLLPSGFESDAERDVRLARGAARARRALEEHQANRAADLAAQQTEEAADEDTRPDTAAGGQP